MIVSICIATFKRGHLIGETLASIAPQLTKEVEVVVLDGASPDDTASVVGAYAERHPNIRYIREETNSGIDVDFDKAVGHARGRHCWLFSDDDLIVPGGVARVLAELAASDPDLLVVDAEIRDKHLAQVFEKRRMPFSGRRIYGPADADRALAELGDALSFIGCAIFRRSAWLARDRASYFGSLFVHVGVAFQQPALPRIVGLGEPLIHIRIANAMWTARGFEIWMFLWPDLIWSFAGPSAVAKRKVVPREPWRQPQKLLVWRAHGAYGSEEYRRFLAPRASLPERLWMQAIARLPGHLAHSLVVGLLSATGHRRASSVYQLVEGSRYSNRLSRIIAGSSAHRTNA